MAIVVPAGDDMPMQVGHQIAQAGEIDFIRRQLLAQSAFNRLHNTHQMAGFTFCQVAHFCYMGLPDDTAKTGECHAFVTRYPHDAAVPVAP